MASKAVIDEAACSAGQCADARALAATCDSTDRRADARTARNDRNGLACGTVIMAAITHVYNAFSGPIYGFRRSAHRVAIGVRRIRGGIHASTYGPHIVRAGVGR